MVSIKRPEENYKFIFKRCLKQMKEKLRAEQPTPRRSKKEFELYFNCYYFEEVVQEPERPLESFLHPKNSNQQNTNAAKTINSQYVSNIVRSHKFVRDFLDYLHNHLEADYRKVISSKIKGLFDKWESEFVAASDKEAQVQRICDNIERNNKCKLPWTIIEVKAAISSVNQLFKESGVSAALLQPKA